MEKYREFDYEPGLLRTCMTESIRFGVYRTNRSYVIKIRQEQGLLIKINNLKEDGAP